MPTGTEGLESYDQYPPRYYQPAATQPVDSVKPPLANQLSKENLMDSKGQNEIGVNLAKLKEDLKMQAEAIKDLRK